MASKKDVSDVSVEVIMAEYNKAAGVTVVGPITEFDLEFDVIPTGCLVLDVCTGVGGLASGKMYEVVGDRASGKSTLCMSVARQFLRLTDRDILYVDIEGAVTSTFLKNLDLYEFGNRFCISTLAVAEDALEMVLKLVKNGTYGLIVIDSIAALLPSSELDKSLNDAEQIGERAKLVQRFIQKINPILGVTKTTLILINQLRTNIKLARINPNLNPMQSTGGKAVEYFPSCKIALQAKSPGTNKRYFDDLGIKLADPVSFTIGKNKLARTCDLKVPSTLRLGFGFDMVYDLIDLAQITYQLTLSGSWYKFNGESIAQGAVGVYNTLLEDADFRDTLIDKTLPLLGLTDTDKHKDVINDFINRKISKYDKGLISFSINS